MDPEEILELVNEEGLVIGQALRSEVHGNPSMIHRVVHVLVVNTRGKILLQKRSLHKDVAPGKWDTSVGGHVSAGEDLVSSSKREMYEELGIQGHEPEYLYSYIHSNEYETELVTTYRCVYEGEIAFHKGEIDEVRYWGHQEIRKVIGRQILSDNFEHEFITFLDYLGEADTFQRM